MDRSILMIVASAALIALALGLGVFWAASSTIPHGFYFERTTE